MANKIPSLTFTDHAGIARVIKDEEMFSPAYVNFFKISLRDVDALIKTYDTLKPKGKGRRYLGHLTRSTVVMLCAAWEQYVEESLEFFLLIRLMASKSPQDLPKHMQKYLCNYINKLTKENDLSMLKIAGSGWRTQLREAYKKDVQRLNTPKCRFIDDLYENVAGIKNVSSNFLTAAEIDDFVTLRGEIAHSGSKASYVKRKNLVTYRKLVLDNVVILERLLHHLITENAKKIAELHGKALEQVNKESKQHRSKAVKV